jgi:ribosomal protein S18 acetylase RimI-like enzyme
MAARWEDCGVEPRVLGHPAGRVDPMVIVLYEPRHLDQVLALSKAEGWATFAANPERARRAMSAPGVTALVAVEDEPGAGGERGAEERLLGFSQAVGDGAITGYLCMLLVAADARGKGIGKALVERTLVEAGVLRLDLLSSEGAMALYERFPHNRMPGFRLYPEESLRPRSS